MNRLSYFRRHEIQNEFIALSPANNTHDKTISSPPKPYHKHPSPNTFENDRCDDMMIMTVLVGCGVSVYV